MIKRYTLINIFLTLILLSGCTHAEIENKANDAGNIIGRFLRGAGNGLVDGLNGEELKRKD